MTNNSVPFADAERQARAAINDLTAERKLPAPHWVHAYGTRPDARASWVSVHLASVSDAHAWAEALGTTPEPDAYLDSDGRLRCRVRVARKLTLPGCPIPVEVAYALDVDAIQAVPV